MPPKASPTAAFDSVMRDLRAGIYKPIYLLMGEESYFIDQISNYITEHALPEDARDFNQSVFYGADTSMRSVVELARRFPMMAERQVVVLREAQSAAEFGLLEKYLEKPQLSTVLVICYKGKIDKRKKYVSQAGSLGVLYESPKMRDTEISAFAEQYARSQGASIDRKSSAMLAEHVGTDVKRLVSEIDKILVSFVPGSPKEITPLLVEKFVGISNEFNGFELQNAITRKDIYKVNFIVDHLMKNPKSGGLFTIMPSMFRFFQNLMLAHYAPAPRDTSAIMSYLSLNNEWAARPYVEGMKHYSAMKTIKIIEKFREVDCKLKGLDNPSTSPEELAKELIFFILH